MGRLTRAAASSMARAPRKADRFMLPLSGAACPAC
jgi:hypothetical protein